MADINDLDKKTSLIELMLESHKEEDLLNHTEMKKSLNNIEMDIDENTKMTFQIKERLDKQNGWLPHLVEDIKQIKEHQFKLMESVNNGNIAEAKKSVKLSILWAVAVAVASSGLTILIKILVD